MGQNWTLAVLLDSVSPISLAIFSFEYGNSHKWKVVRACLCSRMYGRRLQLQVCTYLWSVKHSHVEIPKTQTSILANTSKPIGSLVAPPEIKR